MEVSVRQDRGLIDWLARRGYRIVEAGDVSMARDLDEKVQAPQEPRWDVLDLRPVALSEARPWTGSGYDELRLWGTNRGRPYAGTVLADAAGTAAGRIAWTALATPGGLARPSSVWMWRRPGPTWSRSERREALWPCSPVGCCSTDQITPLVSMTSGWVNR